MKDRSLSIRIAGPDDAAALERLAHLDGTGLPAGRVLLAEVDGELLAAVPLGPGSVIADPFRRNSEAVRLLAMRRHKVIRGGVGVS